MWPRWRVVCIVLPSASLNFLPFRLCALRPPSAGEGSYAVCTRSGICAVFLDRFCHWPKVEKFLQIPYDGPRGPEWLRHGLCILWVPAGISIASPNKRRTRELFKREPPASLRKELWQMPNLQELYLDENSFAGAVSSILGIWVCDDVTAGLEGWRTSEEEG